MLTMCTTYQFNFKKTMNKPTIVQLSDEDALKFMQFMEHYDAIRVLIEAKVFEQKKATIALNFDHNGVLKSVQRADFLYSSNFDKL